MIGKKIFTMGSLLALAAGAFLGWSGVANAGVVDSKHDLMATSSTPGVTFDTGPDRVCIFCHTPHSNTVDYPLWNRINPTSGFTMYTSVTLDMTIQSQPKGVSASCLSCHDGATAFNSLKNQPAVAYTTTPANATLANVTGTTAVIGTELGDDHPISVTYNPALDTAFNPIGDVRTALRLYDLTANSEDQVECGTCHDPHDNTTNVPFLRISNANSGLCTTCHNK